MHLHSDMPSLDRVARAQTKRVNIRRASLSVPLGGARERA
jgi:hypothetical protein